MDNRYITNKLGNLQMVDEDGYEVCDQCNCCYKNLGAGTSCDACRTAELIECEKNYCG
jgi:hypothetical protein